MSIYELNPEVPCEPGSETVWDTSVHPPRLSNVALEFDSWLGDDLIETFPLFAVTDRLRAALEEARVCGVSFERVPVTKSEQYAELNPEDEIGMWSLMTVSGREGTGDDAWLNAGWGLVVSQRFWDVVAQFHMTYGQVAEHPS